MMGFVAFLIKGGRDGMFEPVHYVLESVLDDEGEEYAGPLDGSLVG